MPLTLSVSRLSATVDKELIEFFVFLNVNEDFQFKVNTKFREMFFNLNNNFTGYNYSFKKYFGRSEQRNECRISTR